MKGYDVIIRHQAQKEVEEIHDHQYAITPKRAERFDAEWMSCLGQLGRNPSKAKRKGSYGHVILGRLPYRVVYEIKGQKVIIYQVRHTSRRPSKRFGP